MFNIASNRIIRSTTISKICLGKKQKRKEEELDRTGRRKGIFRKWILASFSHFRTKKTSQFV